MFLQSAKYISRDRLYIKGCNAVFFWDQYFTQDAVVGAQYFVQDAVVEVITSSKSLLHAIQFNTLTKMPLPRSNL